MSDVRWYFDYISPFAYLQWRRLQRDHMNLQIQPVPILLGAVLQHHGQLGPAEIAGKREHTYRQVMWRAEQERIELNFPPAHPFNPLPALRLTVAANNNPSLINTLFTYIWQTGLSADSSTALASIAKEHGIDNIDEALASDEIKSTLRSNTEQALAAGVFGVPTLDIQGELFWGDDSTAMAMEFLCNPKCFNNDKYQKVHSIPQAVQRNRS